MTIEADFVERSCIVMHEAYESAARDAGWETQERSRVPWRYVPEANKVTMRAAVKALLESLENGEIRATKGAGPGAVFS